MQIQPLLPYQSGTRPRTIWIEDPISSVKLKHYRDDSLVLKLHNCGVEDMGPDSIPATEEDIIKALRFAERFSKTEDIWIWSPHLELTLAFTLGLECWHSRDPNAALYKVLTPYFISTHPLIPNLWVIDIFDYSLGFAGDLITRVEDYMVTGVLVTPKGEVLETLEVKR